MPRRGAASLRLRPGKQAVLVRGEASRALTGQDREWLRRVVRDVFGLDADISGLHALLDAEPRRRWVVERRAGRMLRSPTAFEDLVKLLLTTNCSWAATVNMVNRLVEALGEPAPNGERAFPRPRAMAAKPPGWFRRVVRAGYRAEALCELSRRVDRGEIHPETWRRDPPPEAQLRETISGLRGFGPYATGHMLRLLGYSRDLCLDSWCRNKLAEQAGRKKPPADKAIEKRYRRYGEWAGLVLWLDLTREWYERASLVV